MLFCCDRKVLIGIGIGMIISALVLSGVNFSKPMSKAQIEEQAKSYGMDYPSAFKVIMK